jgi:hypothetical protein
MKSAIILAAWLTCSATLAAADPSPMTAFGDTMGALQRGWRQDCAAGGADAQALVTFSIDGAGELAGEPTATSDAHGPAAEAAMRRAIVAVKRAAPFKALPSMFYNKQYHVVFDGHDACKGGAAAAH